MNNYPQRKDYLIKLAPLVADDDIAVCCLGQATTLWEQMRPKDSNFYVCDSMGLAFPLAIGMAASLPDKRVIAMEGDGGLLMCLGAIVTTASLQLENLMVLLFDNGVYEASGYQPLPTDKVDYEKMAAAAGFPLTATVTGAEQFGQIAAEFLRAKKLSFICLKTEINRDWPLVETPMNQLDVKYSFKRWLDSNRSRRSTGGGSGR